MKQPNATIIASDHDFSGRHLSIADKLRWPEKEYLYRKEYLDQYMTEQKIEVRKPFAPISVVSGIDWEGGYHDDKTWRLYFHSLYWFNILIRGIEHEDLSFSEKNSLTEDLKRYTIGFVEYFHTNSEQKFPDSIWDDHSASYRISYIALVFEKYICPIIEESEYKDIKRFVAKHIEKIRSFILDPKWDNSNHRLFQIEGLCDGALAFSQTDEEKNELIEFGKTAFVKFVNDNISLKDGTTKEHALFYHAFLMGRIHATAEYFRKIGQDFDIDFAALFLKMNSFLWTVMPDRYLVPGVGDTKHNMYFDKKHIRAFENETYENGTVRYIKTLGAEGIVPGNLSDFQDDGYYIFRRGNISDKELYSLFLEKKYIGPHGHVDGNSFVTYFNKEPFFIDSGGPYRYGVPLRYHYFQTQLAHNTVLFGQAEKYFSTVRTIQRSPNLDLVEGIAEFSANKFWSRTFCQAFNDVVIIVDYVTSFSAAQADGAKVRYLLSPQITLHQLGTNEYQLNGETAQCTVGFINFGNDSSSQISTTKKIIPRQPVEKPEKLAIEGQLALVTEQDTFFTKTNLLQRALSYNKPLITYIVFENGLKIDAKQNDDEVHIRLNQQDKQAELTIYFDNVSDSVRTRHQINETL